MNINRKPKWRKIKGKKRLYVDEYIDHTNEIVWTFKKWNYAQYPHIEFSASMLRMSTYWIQQSISVSDCNMYEWMKYYQGYKTHHNLKNNFQQFLENNKEQAESKLAYIKFIMDNQIVKEYE